MKNNKYIFVGIWILLVILWSVIYYFNNNNKETIIWRVIDQESYDMNLLIEETWTGEVYDEEKEKKQEKDYGRIKSMSSVLCSLWNNVDTLLGTSSFKLIKQTIDEIWNSQDNKEAFLYVDLPWIVFDACPNNDSSFVDKLVTYLQAESITSIENDQIDIKKYNLFVENITFDNEWINKDKLKTDKQYFEDVFFKDNLEAITSSYFSEYLYNANNPDDFFGTYSILSITDSNDVLEATLWNFEWFLNKVWINGIEEFRIQLLQNNNFSDIGELKEKLKNDYKELQKMVQEEYEIDLNSVLVTSNSSNEFYKNDYLSIINNEKINTLFQNIWKNYLLFSMISNDYADWLDETWSAKEFFWDHLTWNWIIKIWFIYLLNSKKK